MEKLNSYESRQSLQIVILINLIIFSVSIHSTLANTTVKDTIIWEYYFTDMNNPYDMAVRTISLNQETKRVFV
ncbi:MAG: hypothetical protein EAX86_08330, partial [Candidatus Heimdallarchaeota archaeon]|nr:hypothetical protein [Candidatus Heimdallarchaeota archaeon]